MADVIGYVYKTTNLVNGKVYIGQHQREALDRRYYGSGKVIAAALKKYGKQAFRVEVLSWEANQERLDEAERHFIAALDARNPKRGYNLAEGGHSGMKGLRHTAEANSKNRRAHLGKKHTEEHKRRLHLAMLGKNAGKVSSDEARRRNADAHRGRIPWNKGIPCTEEMKKRIGETKVGKPWSEARRAAYERKKLKVAS